MGNGNIQDQFGGWLEGENTDRDDWKGRAFWGQLVSRNQVQEKLLEIYEDE